MTKLNKIIIIALSIIGMTAFGYANVTNTNKHNGDNHTPKLGSSLYLYAPVF